MPGPGEAVSLDPSEDELGDESAADIGQHKHEETCKRPPQSDSSTPAIRSTAYQQRGKDAPGKKRKKSLVIKYYRLVEYLFRKHHAACKSDS